ncbi:MAG: hypothetical protein ACO25Q_06910 [Sediminibacterium sp.]
MIYTVIASITILLGGLIAWGILSTQWKTETIKMSLSQGQNPLYAMCAMESHNEICKSMVTAMSLSGQFKDSSAPTSTLPIKK